MRVVLDTDVVTSALLWDGTPEHLIEAAGAGKRDPEIEQMIVDEVRVARAERRKRNAT